MEPTQLTYPQFVANQVLKKDHLNDLFRYLDEQNRLTRTNLIGIGVVCGLEVIPDPAQNRITVTRGCGVTSAGYLVSLPVAILTRYRPYTLPELVDYPPFYTSGDPRQQFPLWELLPSGGGDTLALSPAFWANKVVLVFVELLEENLKNCSPYSCDDRGSVIEVAYRYLLLNKTDADELKKIQAEQTGGTSLDQLENLRQAQSLLPEMRLQRFDVPMKSPAIFTTQEVIDGFRATLTRPTVEGLKAALLQAYTLYQPLLPDLSDTAMQQFGSAYTYTGDRLSVPNPLLYPYYHDFFSDLIEAYNEIRALGLEVISMCCPDADLFPRHLFLGLATEDTTQTHSQYRHYFLPSPLFSDRQHLGQELRMLFRRLLRMLEHFTVAVPSNAYATGGIRITPSFLGKIKFSEKAIPFYYNVMAGSPPLYEVWSPEKARQNKAKHNLSYHADAYPNPVPDFVQRPLEYDLEPYNFFRVEGHVGLQWQYALSRLIQLRRQYRLPFELLVLKTGRNFKDVQDWRTHACSFQDLEAIYQTIKEDLTCLLRREAAYFYKLKPGNKRVVSGGTSVTGMAARALQDSKVRFFNQGGTAFQFDENSIGAFYENAYLVNNVSGTLVRVLNLAQEQPVQAVLLVIQYLVELGDYLDRTTTLPQFSLEQFQLLNQNLQSYASTLVGQLKERLAQQNNDNREDQWQLEDAIDHLDVIINACKKEAFAALVETYRNRLEKIQEQLLFGNYVQKHPGITHKAGVPVGGTLVLVYAGEDGAEDPPPQQGRFRVRGQVVDTNQNPLPGATLLVKNTTIGTMTDASGNFLLFVQFLPATVVVSFVGFPTQEMEVRQADTPLRVVLGEEQENDQQGEVPHGRVFVDFYLPYLCCSDCPPVQFNLEMPATEEPDELVVEVSEPECDRTGRFFTVTLSISGGTSPYTVDEQPVTENPFPLQVPNAEGKTVVVRDSADQEQEVDIPAHECPQPPEDLRVTVSDPVCDESGRQFTVTLQISGGTAPYTVNEQPVSQEPHPVQIPSGQGQVAVVADSAEQKLEVQIPAHTCESPPEDLVVAVGDPQCDSVGRTYTVTLTISGGKEPYAVNGEAISGNTHPDTIPSGQGREWTVTDASMQTQQVRVEPHTCPPVEEPCDLPCDGKAELCWYPLWMPKPAKGQVLSTQVEVGKLVVVDQENDKTYEVDFSSVFKELFSQAPEEEFHDRVRKLLDWINEQLAQQIGDPGTLVFHYNPEERLLGVERYQCHTFSLDAQFTLSLGNTAFALQIHYTEQDWLIHDRRRNTQATGKKFGCEEMDKCRDTRRALCEQEIPQEEVKVTVQRLNNGIGYRVEPRESFDFVLWFFGSGTPLFSQDREGVFRTHTDESPVWFLGVRGACYVVKEGSPNNQ